MAGLQQVHSRTVVIETQNIDTDQIIPARFLTTTSREGLGKRLFNDWRYEATGALRSDFILNTPSAQGCQILVAGRNFGCGSSREHAPWALVDYGFKAVISTEIADIFKSNSLKNGLLPIVVDETTHQWLIQNPGIELEIDLASRSLKLPTQKSVSFPLENFARYCLLNGVDELGFLLSRESDIKRFEQQLS
jgi:3-isopropylmalate/(R)-2-methylmalate dehydratase small subunit